MKTIGKFGYITERNLKACQLSSEAYKLHATQNEVYPSLSDVSTAIYGVPKPDMKDLYHHLTVP